MTDLKDVPTWEMRNELALRGFIVSRKHRQSMRCKCGKFPSYVLKFGHGIAEHYHYTCDWCGRDVSGKDGEEALRNWNKMIITEEEK